MMTVNKKTFKDFIDEDLDVFFDLDEFADEHELEGETLTLVVVDNKLDDSATGIARDHLYASQEVYKHYKTVYVKASDFFVPKVDSGLTLDGEEYYVEEAADEKGIIRILLSANES